MEIRELNLVYDELCGANVLILQTMQTRRFSEKLQYIRFLLFLLHTLRRKAERMRVLL